MCEGEAAAELAAASVASLGEWRRDAVALRGAMEAAGWQTEACSVDDVTRRVVWGGDGKL